MVGVDFDIDDEMADELYGNTKEEIEENFIFIDTTTVFIGLWTTCFDLSQGVLISSSGRVDSEFCRETNFDGLVIYILCFSASPW